MRYSCALFPCSEPHLVPLDSLSGSPAQLHSVAEDAGEQQKPILCGKEGQSDVRWVQGTGYPMQCCIQEKHSEIVWV